MHHALSVKLNGKNHVSKTDLFTDCTKAVDLIVKGMEGAINSKSVIYDF
ncbi:isocitrate dehydrogenase [Escherichia coli]|nr:isocitrate dehydrogenase [Escherichia coli]GCS17307.1 isocitrate dehydrogenase [Escherichia coli]GDH42068.1 isocitrate dehydrogenase [Escherichia coli]